MLIEAINYFINGRTVGLLHPPSQSLIEGVVFIVIIQNVFVNSFLSALDYLY